MQRKVSLKRDFPHGCGTHECHRPACFVDKFKEAEAGFNAAASGVSCWSGRLDSTNKLKFPPSFGSKVKPLSVEETTILMASQRRKRHSSSFSRIAKGKPLVAKAVQRQRNSPEKKNRYSNATALRESTCKQTQNREKTRLEQRGLNPVMQQDKTFKRSLSPREKVLRVLHRFKLTFKTLDRAKATRRGESKTATSRIDYKTRNILMREGMQVNAGKMIGPVPGVEVGDEFQFKSELNLIGLHFDIMGGIDYMNEEGTKLATSIVSSEGNGYSDRFDYDEMIYSGQGGNVTSKDERVMEDQKLVTGNLALANSMREKSPVRVIRGLRRSDHRGKRYVYVGLYTVIDCWKVKGPEGKVVYKFKLRRVSGQPYVDLRH